MGQNITLKASDGFELSAYRADPDGAPKGGLVLIQEIFGVNSHIRNVCDRFAKQGYVVVAPAMFDRAGKGIELGYEADDRQKGIECRQKLNDDMIMADVNAARDYLKSQNVGKIGIIGFCFGGSVTWMGAVGGGFDAASSFYGGQVIQTKDAQPKCPVQFHFGETDQSIPLTDVEEIKKAHPDLPAYVYAGAGHGFVCDDRGSYNAEATKLAFQRTDEFFSKNIG